MRSIGVELVERERERQVQKEGWTSAHDDEHVDGELALVAALFAAPIPLYTFKPIKTGFVFRDPWPPLWDAKWDKRPKSIPSPDGDRIGVLVKAGALICAEIDRLKRSQTK